MSDEQQRPDGAKPLEIEDEGSYEVIRIYIVDETYPPLCEEEWPEQSRVFAHGLEAEFGQPFAEDNIGPGADLPAYVTILSVGASLLGMAVFAFFKGKAIEDNLDAWIRLANRIKRYWHRKPILDRQGAGVVAAAAVAEQALPKSLRLLSYRAVTVYDLDGVEATASGVDEDMPSLHLGRLAHHEFVIVADGSKLKVRVSSTEIDVEHPDGNSVPSDTKDE